MPRDEEGRKKARKHARVALILCVVMLGALTPVFAALSDNTISAAQAQPNPLCTTLPSPPPQLMCPPSESPSGSTSPSASQTASASTSPTASRSASATATATASATPSASATPTPTATPSRTASASPSPSRTPQEFNSPSDISIKHKKGRAKFFGRVTSDFDECRRGRRVSLFYEVPGFGTSRRVGKATTNSRGGWNIKEKNPDGKYFAAVKASRVTTPAGDTIFCRKDRSRKVKG